MDTVDDRTFKEKFDDFRGRVALKAHDVWTGVKENKELVVGSVILLAPVVLDALKLRQKHYESVEFKRTRDKYIWDPKHHHWVEARRPLKPREVAELDDRMDDGESASSILRDMKLL